MKWRRRRDSGLPTPILNFKSVFVARTDCASPVVSDQTDSRAHGEVLQKSFAVHPPPFAIVLKYSRCPTSMRLEGLPDVTSLSCCFPAVSMKATVSKNGYRHSIAGASPTSVWAHSEPRPCATRI